VPAPLGYRDPDDDRRPAGKAAVAGSFAAGVAVVTVIGCAGFGGMESGSKSRWLLAVFIPLALSGLIAAVRLMRSSNTRPLLAAFLLGLGVCALCEGICYTY
jgi:hypothetical protein